MARVARSEEGPGLLPFLKLKERKDVPPRRGRSKIKLKCTTKSPGVRGEVVFEACPGVEGREAVRAKRRGGKLR
eukprot:2800846-Prorocentrum_lima.AAC.1